MESSTIRSCNGQGRSREPQGAHDEGDGEGRLLELLDEKALGDISVTELCTRADINRTTFYKHYGNPNDVLNDIADELAEGAAAAAATRIDGEPLPLGEQVATICRHLREHPREARAVLRRFSGDSEFVRRVMRARLSSGQVRMSAYARNCDAETVRLLGAFLSNGIYSLVSCWMLEGVGKTPEEMGALAEDIAMHGWVDG